jgi:hypothetical protein
LRLRSASTSAHAGGSTSARSWSVSFAAWMRPTGCWPSSTRNGQR